MCGDMFTNKERKKELPEGYGEMLAIQDENKTNEEEQQKYDDKKRVW